VLGVIAKSRSAVVKLAPAAEIETAVLGQTHRCWISLCGSVREQSLLCGDVIGHAGLTPDTRSAVSLTSSGSASWFAPAVDDLVNDPTASLQTDFAAEDLSVLVDPDASIRAAGLTKAFARQHGLKLLGEPAGFLTCKDPPSPKSPLGRMATVGNVIWLGPSDDRRLRREFRSRGAFPDVVKVRGTDHDPAELARRYRKCGSRPVTLWIGRTPDRVFAAMTK
jgi:hypothetical protein